MNIRIFSIYDSAAAAYLEPFFAPTRALAIRRILNTIASPNENNFAKYPADFTLFEIGEFCDYDGDIDGLTVNVNLGNLLQLQSTEWTEDDAVQENRPNKHKLSTLDSPTHVNYANEMQKGNNQ